MPSAGERIGPYELLRRLGAGAFGEVWLVRHLDLRVERAMKIPTDPDYVKQLRLEGQIQFDLNPVLDTRMGMGYDAGIGKRERSAIWRPRSPR
jgi:serine/threonine protein kinase